MAGLLDMVNDPRQAFLTQLGMGLLSAGGPSSQPRSFGQAFGAAMGPALQGAQQAQEYQLAQEEARRKQMAEMARQQAIETMPEQARAAIQAGVPIGEVWKQLNPTPQFQKWYDEQGREQAGFVTPGTQPMPVGGSKLPDWMNPAFRAYELEKARSGGVKINVGGEGKGAIKAYEAFGSNLPEQKTIAENSANVISRIGQIRQNLPQAYTGAGATLKDRYAQVASFFGVNVPELAAGQTVDNAMTSLTAAIAKTFGANPSVYETQLLELLSGKRSFEPKALGVILDNIEKDARARIRSYNKNVESFGDPSLSSFMVQEPPEQVSKPRSKQFDYNGKKVIGTLQPDGSYIFKANGKTIRATE